MQCRLPLPVVEFESSHPPPVVVDVRMILRLPVEVAEGRRRVHGLLICTILCVIPFDDEPPALPSVIVRAKVLVLHPPVPVFLLPL